MLDKVLESSVTLILLEISCCLIFLDFAADLISLYAFLANPFPKQFENYHNTELLQVFWSHIICWNPLINRFLKPLIPRHINSHNINTEINLKCHLWKSPTSNRPIFLKFKFVLTFDLT